MPVHLAGVSWSQHHYASQPIQAVSQMKRLTIHPHQPLRYLLFVLIVSIVIGAGVWVLAEYSHWRLIREQMAQNLDYEKLWHSNQQLREDKATLERKLARLQTGIEIDRQATADVQDEIVQLQDEVFQLTRELEFYRGVISSGKNADGLAVQGVQVLAADEPQRYHFRLVLTHVEKSDKVAEGTVEVILEGTEKGAARTLKLKDVLREKSLSLDYRFKHFKRFEGTIDLPSAFKPQRIRVQLLPKQDSHGRIERVFDWSAVTG